jgi:hypothetical protein
MGERWLVDQEGATRMSDPSHRGWDDAIAALGRAVDELRAAARGSEQPTAEEVAAETRLRHDLSRLEQSAAELVTKLADGLQQERAGAEASIDRERAEQTRAQLKTALEGLAHQVSRVATEAGKAAAGSLRQAEPEMKVALGALDAVLRSTGAWLRAVVDPQRGRHGPSSASGRPPLDDL